MRVILLIVALAALIATPAFAGKWKCNVANCAYCQGSKKKCKYCADGYKPSGKKSCVQDSAYNCPATAAPNCLSCSPASPGSGLLACQTWNPAAGCTVCAKGYSFANVGVNALPSNISNGCNNRRYMMTCAGGHAKN